MSVWEEIRQLAADLKSVQARSTSHRLSERNCVELIGRLSAAGLLTVLHTQDGKEYVTPQQLEREARAELASRRGVSSVSGSPRVRSISLPTCFQVVLTLWTYTR